MQKSKSQIKAQTWPRKNGSTSSPHRRPVGVIIIGCIETFVGFVALIFLLYCLATCFFILLKGGDQEAAAWAIAIAAFLFPFLINLICGIGILRLKNWARILNITLYPFFQLAPWGFIVYSTRRVADISKTAVFILLVVICVCIIYYLTRPKVKALFSPERGEAESKESV